MTVVRPTPVTPATSPHYLPDAPVLRGRLLGDSALPAFRRGRGLPDDRPPVFGDDVWPLGWAHTRRNVEPSKLLIDFRGIEAPVRRLTAKEYLYARLNERVMGIKCALPVQIVREELNFLLAFFAFLDNQQGAMALGEVDQEVLDAYRLWCQAGTSGRGAPIGAAAVAKYISVTIRLALCGEFLSQDRLQIMPWRGRSAYVVAGVVERTENATPRIPEAVLGALLRWALFYVEVAAADILAASNELAQLEARLRTPPDPSAQLSAWIETRRAAGRGIPALAVKGAGASERRLSANTNLVRRMAGLPGRSLDSDCCQRMLRDAVNELGLELGGLDTAVSPDPSTGRPWRSPFTPKDLRVERRMVQAACYIVCAYLSGMRDSELQELRRGCHVVERSADGVIGHHKLRGQVFKGRGAQGEQASWVVIDPVVRAVEVLEAMHSHDHLLTSPSHAAYPSPAVRSGDLTGGARLGPSVVRLINEFRDHLNATQSEGGEAAVPDHEGRPWHFTTGQFRRTLAWHIAHQPFGIVAGMLQYQHVSVATFEGYVGQSPSGFQREVETERRLAALDDLVDDYRDHMAGLPSTGGGCGQAQRRVRPRPRQSRRLRAGGRRRPPAGHAQARGPDALPRRPQRLLLRARRRAVSPILRRGRQRAASPALPAQPLRQLRDHQQPRHQLEPRHRRGQGPPPTEGPEPEPAPRPEGQALRDGGGHRSARPAVSRVSPAAEQALQEALGRLGEGRPLRTDGALTVSGLAVEAGVSRSTANRASTVLAALRALRSAAESRPTPASPASDERAARNEMELLRRAHGQRVAALEASIDTLAQHVQVLTLDNERLRRTVATYAGNVTPMKDAEP